MKIFQKFIIAYFIFCSFMLLHILNRNYYWTSPTIKIGQIWIQTYGNEDPFKIKEYDTIKILDIKGDYVQYARFSNTRYTYKGKADTIIESDKKHWIYDLAVLQK